MESTRPVDSKADESKLAFEHAAEEIRFFKGQQWNITNYALLLQAALVGAMALIEVPARAQLRPIAAIFAVLIAVAAAVLLETFEDSVSKERERMGLAREQLPHLKALHANQPSPLARRTPFVTLIFVNAIASAVGICVIWNLAQH